eukprot:1474760-Pleurochrysis_carterae.AAC.1
MNGLGSVMLDLLRGRKLHGMCIDQTLFGPRSLCARPWNSGDWSDTSFHQPDPEKWVDLQRLAHKRELDANTAPGSEAILLVLTSANGALSGFAFVHGNHTDKIDEPFVGVGAVLSGQQAHAASANPSALLCTRSPRQMATLFAFSHNLHSHEFLNTLPVLPAFFLAVPQDLADLHRMAKRRQKRDTESCTVRALLQATSLSSLSAALREQGEGMAWTERTQWPHAHVQVHAHTHAHELTHAQACTHARANTLADGCTGAHARNHAGTQAPTHVHAPTHAH